ncbi:Neurochondrin [Sesbania bispinosa]|nr:Neurochondrin [Sesbania bispinosa]
MTFVKETQQELSPNLEECLKLLKESEMNSVSLDFFWSPSMGRGTVSSGGDSNRDAYLSLSVTVLAAFCRVPEIASSEDMIFKIPLILEVMSTQSGSSVLEECYEFLYLVSTASENGVMRFYESRGIKILASQMSSLQDGSHLVEISIKLLQLILSRMSLDTVQNDYLSELPVIVAAIARQFSVLHNSLKFEALHLLNAILSSKDSPPLLDALHYFLKIAGHITSALVSWPFYRIVLVSPAERLQALILAESMVSIYGKKWLISQVSTNDAQDPTPADMCLLLVLEQSRVEIAVLLNELAYLKIKIITLEMVPLLKFSPRVMVNIMQLLLYWSHWDLLDEGTLTKLIRQLNETIVVVLEYLEDAKEHSQKKGDDLLASVRIIGRSTTCMQREGSRSLGYMLSVEGEDEQGPFCSVCFLLPMLCQITMKVEDAKLWLHVEDLRLEVIDCLCKLIGSNDYMGEDNGCVFLACDTIMNLLLKKDKVQLMLDESAFVDLLKALACWSGNTDDMSSMMMASSICALVFDYTSEEALLNHPDFDQGTLSSLYQLIARCLSSSEQETKTDMDLFEIISADGYVRSIDIGL